jgi:hypothetical protein
MSKQFAAAASVKVQTATSTTIAAQPRWPMKHWSHDEPVLHAASIAL